VDEILVQLPAIVAALAPLIAYQQSTRSVSARPVSLDHNNMGSRR